MIYRHRHQQQRRQTDHRVCRTCQNNLEIYPPLTHETFTILLARVEAIMNYIPFCLLYHCPTNDFDYLTHGHFLRCAPVLLICPEEPLLQSIHNFNARWRKLTTRSVQNVLATPVIRIYSQSLTTSEVVQDYTKSHIWTIGSLREERNLPPTALVLGRVMEVIPGNDGIVEGGLNQSS